MTGPLPDWAAGLGLQRHPEGGWFAETWRSEMSVDLPGYPASRALGTAILFLLLPGEESAWHRVKSAELWFHHAGSALELTLGGDGEHPSDIVSHRLGPDVANHESPQLLVPPEFWQAARPLGDEPVLVSCVVVPGFDFADFTLLGPSYRFRAAIASAHDGRRQRETSVTVGGDQVADAFALQSRIAAAARGSGRPVIDAGRGQPNWTVTEPRAAFFRLGLFATQEAERYSTTNVWGEMPPVAGIHDRLLANLADDVRTDIGTAFLRSAVQFAIGELGFDPDEWVHELFRSVLGFGYPSPNRMQPHLEQVAERYVVRFTGSPLDDDHRFDVFATEGGAAAMTYIFTTLQVNGIVGPGDAVAVATPTYTPYLQIPVLERIGFDVVEIKAVAHQPYRFDEGALDALRDPRIKVFFLINPGNPDSRAVRPERLEDLRRIIDTERPDLLVVNDTAYATFVESFHGVTAVIPRNVILLHSFSKGYAATGNRLGFVAVHRDSVADELLAGKSVEAKERMRARYQAASDDVDAMPFIQRLLADSRLVALHNIAGLATPDQVQMTLFELAYLMPEGAHYVEGARAKLQARLDALYAGLGVASPGGKDSHYYGMVDIMTVARARHGEALVERIRGSMAPEEVALRLAADSGVIVQTGPSFQGDPWDVRLSLASITEDQAGQIAAAFVTLVDRLAEELTPAGEV